MPRCRMPNVSSVLESARFIASHSQYVHINKPAITQAAHNVRKRMMIQTCAEVISLALLPARP